MLIKVFVSSFIRYQIKLLIILPLGYRYHKCLFRQRNSKWRYGPVAKIATWELNDKEGGAEVRRAVHHRGRYIITEKSLREFQIGGSVFRAVVRLNVSRIAPRTFRVDAHTTFINERIFRLPFWPPVSLSLIRHLIPPTPSRLPHDPPPPSRFRLKRLSSSLRGKYGER